MENKESLEVLLNKYLKKGCTVQEIRCLLSNFDLPQHEGIWNEILSKYFEETAHITHADELIAEKAVNELRPGLLAKIQEESRAMNGPVRLTLWVKFTVAAAVILCLSAGLYFFLIPSSEQTIVQHQIQHKDIQPGGNKATLLLADGSEIVLNDVKDGEIARQNGAVIVKTKNGQLVSSAIPSASSVKGMQLTYNILSTPRGGQYRIILPDGSKVWLNAASSLKYPVAFDSKERNVELKGEGYFEIAKDSSRPFTVVSSGQTVKVLGTHFNINAYGDESVMKTTLLEGSIDITYGQVKALIKPGEQAWITAAIPSKINVINETDTEEAVSWKDGYFQFNHADIQTVMRQLARWYDISVKYEGKRTSKEFGGAIQKDLTLSKVLNILEKSGVHFKVNGKEVVVMP